MPKPKLSQRRQRAAVQAHVRRRGLKTVAARFGLSPATLAGFIAGAGEQRPGTLRAVDLGFEQLGPNLGFEPELELPRRELAPALRLVRASATVSHVQSVDESSA